MGVGMSLSLQGIKLDNRRLILYSPRPLRSTASWFSFSLLVGDFRLAITSTLDVPLDYYREHHHAIWR